MPGTSLISRKAACEVNKIPHYFGHRQRLRDRFLKTGFSGMAEHEVLKILLTLIIPRKDVKEPAEELLSRFGNLYGVLNAPFKKLREVKRIVIVAPVAFRIIRKAAGIYLCRFSLQGG
jgi:DNA repair protein RadC